MVSADKLSKLLKRALGVQKGVLKQKSEKGEETNEWEEGKAT
jgi:hypothetical protein